jgi:hypothetical protein
MHVRQRFQEIVPEQPDGLLRPRRREVVRHPASPTGERRFYTAAAGTGQGIKRGRIRSNSASQRRGRGRAAGKLQDVPVRAPPHDGCHLRRERRWRGLDLVPAVTLDRPAVSSRPGCTCVAALQRVDHLAAAHRRDEQHLRSQRYRYIGFVSSLELPWPS